MQNGEVIKHEYQLNLDTLAEGMIIGLMRHNDKTLHFYLNEVDQGEACTDVPSVIYPIVDLYGQCAQVSHRKIYFHFGSVTQSEKGHICLDNIIKYFVVVFKELFLNGTLNIYVFSCCFFFSLFDYYRYYIIIPAMHVGM